MQYNVPTKRPQNVHHVTHSFIIPRSKTGCAITAYKLLTRPLNRRLKPTNNPSTSPQFINKLYNMNVLL